MEFSYDLRYWKFPPTGEEMSLETAVTPDIRNGVLSIEDIQAPFLTLSTRLSKEVPRQVRERIDVVRSISTYAYFCYELHAVSVMWALSTIEMAVKVRFQELTPGPYFVEKKSKNQQISYYQLDSYLRRGWRIPGMPRFDFSFRSHLEWAFETKQLPDDLNIPVQEIIAGYNNRLQLEVFPEWAEKEGLLTMNGLTMADIDNCWNSLTDVQRDQFRFNSAKILTEQLPPYRNELSHPRLNFITVPSAPVRTFDLLTDIVSKLWPHRTT